MERKNEPGLKLYDLFQPLEFYVPDGEEPIEFSARCQAIRDEIETVAIRIVNKNPRMQDVPILKCYFEGKLNAGVQKEISSIKRIMKTYLAFLVFVSFSCFALLVVGISKSYYMLIIPSALIFGMNCTKMFEIARRIRIINMINWEINLSKGK